MENLDIKCLFNDIYKDKTVLVTGDSGFKGSWLVEWLHLLGAKVVGYSIAPVTTPTHSVLLNRNYIKVVGDINDYPLLEKTFLTYSPDIVFHLAAQPLVRTSYQNPHETYQTNVMGTLNVYEAVRNTPSVKAMVCVTTDKVYSNQEDNRAFKEKDNLGGYDPYSASKACVEILSASYRNSFFQHNNTLIATARAGNVIGGGDWAKDRLIPDIIRNTVENHAVIIRNPEAIRPWQHVLESLSGYLVLGQKLLENNVNCATAWNFGPNLKDCQSVQQVLKLMQKHWAKINFSFEKDAKTPHEAHFLRLNCHKAKQVLSWKPIWHLEKAIEKTAIWYKAFYENNNLLTEIQIQEYIKEAKQKNAIWIDRD